MSGVIDEVECTQCGKEAVYFFETRDSSTEVTCHNCGYRSYRGPKYDESHTVVQEWVTEAHPGFGSVLVKPLGHIATAVYYLQEPSELNYWLENLKSHKQEVEFARIFRWNPETQVTEEIYQIGQVRQVNQKNPQHQSREVEDRESSAASDKDSELPF